jgi:hypothetical protein
MADTSPAQSWVRGAGALLRVCCAGEGVAGVTADAGPEPSLREPIIGVVDTFLSLTHPTNRDAVTRSNAVAIRIVFSPVLEASTFRQGRRPRGNHTTRGGVERKIRSAESAG